MYLNNMEPPPHPLFISLRLGSPLMSPSSALMFVEGQLAERRDDGLGMDWTWDVRKKGVGKAEC